MPRPEVQNRNVTEWISRGRKIRKSLCHEDMFIVENGDGKFHVINTSLTTMLTMNPPDREKKVRGRTPKSQLVNAAATLLATGRIKSNLN
jgi:hypothetical protein